MGKFIGMSILILAIVFLTPWIVQITWGMIAVNMFGAPVMSYWAAFFGTWAMHILFRQMSYKNKD